MSLNTANFILHYYDRLMPSQNGLGNNILMINGAYASYLNSIWLFHCY